LQELDLDIESRQQALEQAVSQLGESQEVARVQNELSLKRHHLEELKHQHHSAEWEIDDLTSKINTLEQKLYDGSIKNPKELASLQHEIDGLKVKRDQLEDRALEVIDQVEVAEAGVAAIGSELKKMETEWQRQQQHLTADIERLKNILADLEHKRQLMLDRIDPKMLDLYQGLRKGKGTAVAKVDQGTCRGCRISLPAIELQQARSGSLVKCSSCGRILFLA